MADEIPLLDIEDLTVTYGRGRTAAVDRVSFEIAAGETLGLVGESGCGKSSLAHAVLGYVSAGGRISGGRVRYRGRDILGLPPRELRALRGGSIALVGQLSMSALNPSMRIAAQLGEVVRYHLDADVTGARIAAHEILQRVRFRDPGRIAASYPHQLSGGQAQRVVLAMALLGEPSLLVLDEPTTALDATVEAEILELIARIRSETRMSMLFVSHDINLVGRITDRVAVMAGGRILEQGKTESVFGTPGKYYTRSLIAASPKIDAAPERVSSPPGDPVISVEGIEKFYRRRTSAFGTSAKGGVIHANRNVSISVRAGETLAVIGESGSGKSTLAKIAIGLETADEGSVHLLGHDVGRVPVGRRAAEIVCRAQMVFQNPESTLTPTRTVGAQIARAVKKLGGIRGKEAIQKRTAELMAEVNLRPAFLNRYPAQLSGGEKQRVAIARARACELALLVADEPVSALDATVQKAVLDVIDEARRERGTAVMLISHDLAVVRAVADRIAVMFGGMVMEEGTTAQIFDPPFHPYTLILLAAALGETLPRAEVSGMAPEAGCPFFLRCHTAIPGTCDTAPPPRQEAAPGHVLACHVPIEELAAED